VAVPSSIDDGGVVPGMAERLVRDDEPAPDHGREGVTVRRRRTPTPVVLPPVALPLTPERRERAVAALTQLFTAWWQQHGEMVDGRHDPAEDR
jgi:hypothetical protein